MAPRRKDPRKHGGLTLRQITEKFNTLVPRANRAGIMWAKYHMSEFETRAAGLKQLKRLEKDMRNGKPSKRAA